MKGGCVLNTGTKAIRRPLFFLLMFLFVLLFVVCNTSTAHAKKLAYIQVTVDTSNWSIVGGVISYSYNSWANDALEPVRVGASELETLSNASADPSVGGQLLEDLDTDTERQMQFTQIGGAREKKLCLSFPGTISTLKKANDRDRERATIVKDLLIYDLNTAIHFIYPDLQKNTDLGQFTDKLAILLKTLKVDSSGRLVGGTISSDGKTFRISAPTATEVSDYIGSFPDISLTAADYVKITDGDTTLILCYRIPKGYVPINGRTMPDGLRVLSDADDAPYVTWGMLCYEAVANYLLEGDQSVDTSNVYAGKPGTLEKAFAELVKGLLDGLRNILGTWNMDELIFNTGVRGGRSYVGGIFPSSWEPAIWTLFFVFELIGIAILLYAIIHNVVKKATSTVNPVARVSMMEQLQDILMVAIGLAVMPVLLQIVIGLSGSLVDIFRAGVGEDSVRESFSAFRSSNGGLAQVIMEFLYFGAEIFFNFFYGIRSLAVAALIILAPLFLSFIAIDGKRKNLTKTWMKELLANILIQPIHAFVLMIVLILPASSHQFDNLIAIYALIPFTNMIRNLFFGESGGFASQVADRAKKTTNLVMAGVAAAGTGAVVAGIGAGAGIYKGKKASLPGGNEGSEANGGSTNQGESTESSGGMGAESFASNKPSSSFGEASTNAAGMDRPAATVSATRSSQSGSGGSSAINVPASGGLSDAASGERIPTNAENTFDPISNTSQLAENDSPSPARSVAKGAGTVAAGIAGIGLAAAGGTMYALTGRSFGRGMMQMGQNLTSGAGAKAGQFLSRHSGNKPSAGSANKIGANQAGNSPLGNHQEDPYDDGENMLSVLNNSGTGYTEPDGSTIQTLNKSDMQTAGFEDVSYTPAPKGSKEEGITTIRTNENLPENEKARLEAAAQVFKTGTPEQKAAYQQASGIQYAAAETNMKTGQSTGRYLYQTKASEAYQKNGWSVQSDRTQKGAEPSYTVRTSPSVTNPHIATTPDAKIGHNDLREAEAELRETLNNAPDLAADIPQPDEANMRNQSDSNTVGNLEGSEPNIVPDFSDDDILPEDFY